MLAYEDGNCTYLNQLDARNSWWYLFQIYEKSSFSTTLDIFKPLSNTVFSNASPPPGLTVRFLE
jgi:hypothetical protein